MWRKGAQSLPPAKGAKGGLKYPLKGADGEPALTLRTEGMAQLAGQRSLGGLQRYQDSVKRGPFKVCPEQVQEVQPLARFSWL